MGDRARARAKADVQAAIDAANGELAAGAIEEAEWQRRVSDALAGSYLRESDPRWQSGFDGDAALWREARDLVLDAVPADGTFLDVGCATGHLMECLAAWGAERRLRLTVSGLELNATLAAEARRRLREWADRIHIGNVSHWRPPERYTYVRTGLEYVAPGREPALNRRSYCGSCQRRRFRWSARSHGRPHRTSPRAPSTPSGTTRRGRRRCAGIRSCAPSWTADGGRS